MHSLKHQPNNMRCATSRIAHARHDMLAGLDRQPVSPLTLKISSRSTAECSQPYLGMPSSVYPQLTSFSSGRLD